MKNGQIDVVIVGGGMITHDQLLPSIYHMQRRGEVGKIQICALGAAPLRELAEEESFAEAFPGQSFEPLPALDTPDDRMFPDGYKQLIDQLAPRNLVVVAVPDHLHGSVIRYALEHDQHVLTVKPLVLKYDEAIELEKLALDRGLFVGVEYHKRFDRRSLEARRQYRDGRLGEFRCGEARLVEPYYYRYSNFQNWFTKENTDPFTYIGCHYVDLVWFITGLKPVEVTVRGTEGTFPNGNVGYMWSQGHVVWENGAVLGVLNGLGYPDEGAGTNDQGITMYGEGENCGTIIKHNDQFRGCSYGYSDKKVGAAFRYINPDYFRLVPWQGDGLKPVGYGYESVEASVLAAIEVNTAGDDLAARAKIVRAIDDKGIIATPSNSSINELVTEAVRLSILADGQPAVIDWEGTPSVRLR
jgi:D-galacturonate reductase